MAEISSGLPMGFGGGLTRFKEEYNSKFQFSPNAVILFIIVVILFVVSLKFLFPLPTA